MSGMSSDAELVICNFVMSKVAEPGIIRDYYEQGSPLEGAEMALHAAQIFGIDLPDSVRDAARQLLNQNADNSTFRAVAEKALHLVPA